MDESGAAICPVLCPNFIPVHDLDIDLIVAATMGNATGGTGGITTLPFFPSLNIMAMGIA